MASTDKIDLFKEHKAEYAAPKKPTLVTVGKAKYLAVVGRGDPQAADFQGKIGAIYGVAYTLKFTRKAAGQDYKVCTLEALWWGTETEHDLSRLPKDQWNWKLLSRVPDFIKAADLKQAVKALAEKGKVDHASEVALETAREGRCVQMLHVGPYESVGSTVAQIAAFMEANGLTCNGPHHEIYLSDPRRVPPERLKTIVRHPVK